MSGSPSPVRLSRVDLAGAEAGEAAIHVAAVPLDLASHESLDGRAIVGAQVASCDEVVGQGRGLVAGPGLESSDEGALVDQLVLKCDRSEKEMAVSRGGHGMAPIIGGRTDKGQSLRGRPGKSVASPGLSQVRRAFAYEPPARRRPAAIVTAWVRHLQQNTQSPAVDLPARHRR